MAVLTYENRYGKKCWRPLIVKGAQYNYKIALRKYWKVPKSNYRYNIRLYSLFLDLIIWDIIPLHKLNILVIIFKIKQK